MTAEAARAGLGARLLWRLTERWAGLPAVSGGQVEVHRALRIPMPDGVTLTADRYRPVSAGPLPVVLLRTPYRRDNAMDWPLAGVLARRGVQVVVQNVRGTFSSGGEFRAFHQERADGLATLAWLRSQSWCDGRVATAGASYAGYTQWALGPYAEPPLAAMGLAVTASHLPQACYPGEAVPLSDVVSWAVFLARQERALLPGIIPAPRQAIRTRRALRRLPVTAVDRAALGTASPFLQDVLRHPRASDRFWSAADHRPAVADLTCPTSMVTGWYDVFLPALLDDHQALAAAGRDTRITIGPWWHGDVGMLRAMVSDQVDLITGVLTGHRRRARPPVRLYLQRAHRWLTASRWPPAATDIPWYLRPGGGLGPEPAPNAAPSGFWYDPADPTPSVGGALLTGAAKQRDNRRVEARADVLCFTGLPLTGDLDVVGAVTTWLQVRADPPYVDLFVRLCDVDTRGRSWNVCDGIRRLTGPAVDAVEPRPVRVELRPTGYRFARGHRLRVQVAGGAFPQFARNHGTSEPAATAVRTRRSRIEICHDPDHPSRLVLPVLDTDRCPSRSNDER